MIGIWMQFVPESFRRYMRALDRIERVAKAQMRILPFLCATDYHHLLIGNLLSQKFYGQYPRYSPRYAHWKTEVVLKGSQFWLLYGDLVKSITIFERADRMTPTRGAWMGGVPAGVHDRGGKSWFGKGDKGKPKPIAMYGRVMEFGLHTHPERPLFKPTMDEYASAGWKKRGAEALNKIRMAWS